MAKLLRLTLIILMVWHSKKSFKKTWRNSHDKNFMLVNKAIHIIDLLIYSYKIPVTYDHSVLNYAKETKFLDTLKLNLNFKNFISSSIFCSYAIPFNLILI